MCIIEPFFHEQLFVSSEVSVSVCSLLHLGRTDVSPKQKGARTVRQHGWRCINNTRQANNAWRSGRLYLLEDGRRLGHPSRATGVWWLSG
ncbi:hypothetical protein BS78_02G248200 [Paspalum vaginatum]|nr:hypothetical protein BS78_02G248200 [Paspalum vaginatum]